MKEVEAQIAGLRASPRARRALEARVWHHLSKRSKRYARRGRGRGNSLDDGSVGSNDSAGSVASNGPFAEAVGGQPDGDGGDGCWQEGSSSTSVQRGDVSPGHGQRGTRERPAPVKAVDSAAASERVAAQALRAQQVLLRKRCVHFILLGARATEIPPVFLCSMGIRTRLRSCIFELPIIRC